MILSFEILLEKSNLLLIITPLPPLFDFIIYTLKTDY